MGIRKLLKNTEFKFNDTIKYYLDDNSVLCVAASDYYEVSDYIRNYEDFKELISGKDKKWEINRKEKLKEKKNMQLVCSSSHRTSLREARQ